MLQIPIMVHQMVDQPSSGCVLLVHADPSIVLRAMEEVATWPGITPLSIGGDIALALLNVPLSQRGRKAEELIDGAVNRAASTVAVFEIDLLFEPTLNLDPLALFRNAAHRNRVIVGWPGNFAENTLTYAQPGHGHYRQWTSPAVEITLLSTNPS